METIFDHSPTEAELAAIGIDSLTLTLRHGVSLVDPITKSTYKVSKEDSYFDLALLMEERDDLNSANRYWSKIPNRHREYLLGFDNSLTTE